MRDISSFAIAVGLILAATAFGVWAASRVHQPNPQAEDLHQGTPVGGGLYVIPPVY
jgi:hypothetical protein